MASEPGLTPTASDIIRPPLAASCAFRDKLYAPEACQIVVGIIHHAVGQLHPFTGQLFVGNLVEEVADAIEARPALVIGADNVPWRELRIGGGEHRVARPRILEPSASRAQIRRAQLPLP